MTGGTRRRGPRHADDSYPRAERGRRIRWRLVAIGGYAVVTALAWWLARVLGWEFDRLSLGLLAVPYWLVVTLVWRRFGPAMPGLND